MSGVKVDHPGFGVAGSSDLVQETAVDADEERCRDHQQLG